MLVIIIAGIYTPLMFFSACSSWFFKMLFLNIAAVTSLLWSKILSVSAYPTIFLLRFWYQVFIWQMCCRVVESQPHGWCCTSSIVQGIEQSIACAEAPKIFMDCAWFSCNHVVTTTINYYQLLWHILMRLKRKLDRTSCYMSSVQPKKIW
jgi:hypothetical protein